MKIQQKFCKCCKMCKILANLCKFQRCQLDNLVDFEKCCKTRIFLQKSVPIQPKRSNILPNFCQELATTLRGLRPCSPRPLAAAWLGRAASWTGLMARFTVWLPGDRYPEILLTCRSGDMYHYHHHCKNRITSSTIIATHEPDQLVHVSRCPG